MCIGSGDSVEANTLVVYEDGSVLWYAFGFTGNTDRENNEAVAEPSLEPWEDELQRVVPVLENWHTQHRTLHVPQIAVNRIQQEEWHPLAKELTALEARLEDPGPPRYGCDDCSPPASNCSGSPGSPGCSCARTLRTPRTAIIAMAILGTDSSRV